MQLADDALDPNTRIRVARTFCAVLWGFVFAFALAATLLHDGRGLGLSFLAAVVTSFTTILMGHLSPDERLVQPVAYRVAAVLVLAVALFGVALAFVPGTTHASKVIAVFFGFSAILAYRCIVTRGPRAAVGTVVLAMWTWIPVAFLAFGGCGRYRQPPWTETASLHAMWLLLLLLPLLAIAALVSFGPRRDHVPDARLIIR